MSDLPQAKPPLHPNDYPQSSGQREASSIKKARPLCGTAPLQRPPKREDHTGR